MFTIMINDLPERIVSSDLWLIANDGKPIGRVATVEDCADSNRSLSARSMV